MRATSHPESGPDSFQTSPAPRGRTRTATAELRHSNWTNYRGLVTTYTVKVINSGNATATGVRLRVEGRGVSSKSSVGTISADTRETIKIRLKPKKLGKVKTAFKVTSGNAGGKTVNKTIRVKK